jgi:tetratricopeptide (TPR) repeat protein
MAEQPGNKAIRRNLMVGYGHLGDALGPARTGGLGDIPAAASALRKAVEIAKWLGASDPADRTARFDLANAQYRLGAALLEQGDHAADAYRELKDAQDLLAALEKQDPPNLRYRFATLYVTRKVGEALAALGRDAEATSCYVADRALALTFHGTHNENEARNGSITTGVELAKLKAKSGDRSALVLADEAVDYLAKAPNSAQVAWARAMLWSDLAGIYRKFGQTDRVAQCREKSARLWRGMKLPAVLEPQRAKGLAAVEAN